MAPEKQGLEPLGIQATITHLRALAAERFGADACDADGADGFRVGLTSSGALCLGIPKTGVGCECWDCTDCTGCTGIEDDAWPMLKRA